MRSETRSASPISVEADVERQPVGHLERQRLDRDVTDELRQHAADLHTGRLAHELHRHLRADRLVEPDLVEVDVREMASNRILLVVLDDRGMGRLLAVEDDVEDRVEAVRASERASQRPLGDDERVRLLPPAVEDARDQPVAAQASRVTRSDGVPLLHLQAYSFPSHGGGL